MGEWYNLNANLDKISENIVRLISGAKGIDKLMNEADTIDGLPLEKVPLNNFFSHTEITLIGLRLMHKDIEEMRLVVKKALKENEGK